jgi:cysteine-rich repeat protein
MRRGGLVVGLVGVVCAPVTAPALAADGLVSAGATTYGAFAPNGPALAWDIATSPDGRNVYVTDRNNQTLVVFARDASTGAVTVRQTLQDGVPPSPGLTPADGLAAPTGVTVSPNGRNVYVTAAEGTLAAFARDPADGTLQFVEAERQAVAGVDGLGDPLAPTMSPDGRHVFVVDPTANTVAMFLRDTATGVLAFVQVLPDSSPNDGLALPVDAAMSPDGRHLHVAANQDEGLGVFARNATASTLTFVELEQGGIAGATNDRLGFPSSVVVSPDGRHVYASGDDAITAYTRDAPTGSLSVLGGVRGPAEGIDGFAHAIALGPGGDALYALTWAEGGNAIAMYRRDAMTGLLTFVARYPTPTFDLPYALAPSPDDRFLYVVSDHTVTVFRRILCGDATVDAGEQCDDGNASDGDCCTAACLVDATGTPCLDDGNSCTAEACDAGGHCLHTATPGDTCADDDDPCTRDVCSSAAVCEHFAVPADDCTPAPPGRALLSLARPALARRTLKWQWRGPGAPDFGDPTAATGFAFCVFRERGDEYELAVSAALPARGRCGRRPCWKRKRGGFRYTDGAGERTGITQLGLAGGPLRATLTVSGKAGRLSLPSPPIPSDQRLTVQLRRTDTNACWAAGFSGSARSNATRFRAKSD